MEMQAVSMAYAGPTLPLAIIAKPKLKPDWLIPHASWLKYFN
jgi:hypothetical protein